MTSNDFEAECGQRISGKLWDETFNPDHCEQITLSVKEMRYIANLLRADEGRLLMMVGEVEPDGVLARAVWKARGGPPPEPPQRMGA